MKTKTGKWKRANTDWMRDARWGVMTHYLPDLPSAVEPAAMTVSKWNRLVDKFDVPDFVGTVAGTGAGYLIFTIGQSSGYFCSPNKTYEQLTCIKPSRLSKRDLVGEIAAAIQKKGLRFIAYLPSHAPSNHREAVEALRCTPEWDASCWGLKPGRYYRQHPVDERLTEFQRNWEAIIREWSIRWGRTVSGWWIDGCYHADKMYRHADAPNFRSFAEAMKAGNPDSIVAFNPGVLVPVISHTEYDDYTAGEANVMVTPNRYHTFDRFVKGAQFQVLTYLGDYWCYGNPRYSDELIASYTKYINSFGGAVTWDVPINHAGKIPDAYIKQLSAIGRECG
ncbi:MAG: alpha-L-fucosidase [Victivallales bacterium]